MARPAGPKTRCNNQWTESRFKTFIQSLLRQGTRRWAPITETEKDARVERGMYKCALCKEVVPATIKSGKKRVRNVFVDHIEPVVDPTTGFTNWDEYINNMFCEKHNLQVLCKDCHDNKSKEEREVTVEQRKIRKEAHED